LLHDRSSRQQRHRNGKEDQPDEDDEDQHLHRGAIQAKQDRQVGVPTAKQKLRKLERPAGEPRWQLPAADEKRCQRSCQSRGDSRRHQSIARPIRNRDQPHKQEDRRDAIMTPGT